MRVVVLVIAWGLVLVGVFEISFALGLIASGILLLASVANVARHERGE